MQKLASAGIVTALAAALLLLTTAQLQPAISARAAAKVILGPVDSSSSWRHGHAVLSPRVWAKSPWGSDCSLANLTTGQYSLCQLPSIWKNCSQGIYLDIGSNVGVQLRKLYDPWQFPGASVLGLFDQTYGRDRRGVCALGIEANPVHSAYLSKLNAYFKRKGFQALILLETAASINSGPATFHLDHGSPVEWGASLAAGGWQGRSSTTANEVTVTMLDLPAFVMEIVAPLVHETQHITGITAPLGMKLDVEGEEYAILPGLITSGGLCKFNMVYLESHALHFRSAAGHAVNMTIEAMESAFHNMRRANPRCRVSYSHLDDETYLHADTEVPLPT